MKVLIIIPAYNEEASIIKTARSIESFEPNVDFELDYIVINDGSTDKTKDTLIENNIPTIHLIKNLGIGGAVQSGYMYAEQNGYDIAVQFDGDGQHDIESIEDLIKPIIEKS